MFSKFELMGFGASALLMAVALYLFTMQSSVGTVAVSAPEQQAAGIVAVSEGDNREAARGEALLNATSRTSGQINQLVIDDIVLGVGEAEVQKGDTVTVHYIGTLQTGQEFDNSYRRGQPFTFTVGEGRVIAGWEEGVGGMKEGGQRILVIPSDLAYGDAGYGPIPGKATLIFAIELLQINE